MNPNPPIICAPLHTVIFNPHEPVLCYIPPNATVAEAETMLNAWLNDLIISVPAEDPSGDWWDVDMPPPLRNLP